MGTDEKISTEERAAGFLSKELTVLSSGNYCLLPDKNKVVEMIDAAKSIIYPSFFKEKYCCDPESYKKLFDRFSKLLNAVVLSAFAYEKERLNDNELDCKKACEEVSDFVLSEMSNVAALTALDVTATLSGDPAAENADVILLTYPGVEAVFIYRLAHLLYKKKVPLIPRMMTEYAHSKTGIDIHPGATIGKSFVIDHGTGVVIGETTVIGDHVKIYQGVTLGAISLADARSLVGKKRHPTIEDGVTIYSGATVLGGETVIGKGAVIGSSVFITASVPNEVTVASERPKLKLYKNNPLD